MKIKLQSIVIKKFKVYAIIINIIRALGILSMIAILLLIFIDDNAEDSYFGLFWVVPELIALFLGFFVFAFLFISNYKELSNSLLPFIMLFLANFSFVPSTLLTIFFDVFSQDNFSPLIALIGCASAFVMSWQQSYSLKITTRDKIQAQQETLRVVEEQKDVLERTVDERTAELRMANARITDSIQYASRIQGALLPDLSALQTTDISAALHYLPRDVVGGDFYWFARQGYQVVIAVADCTGHGVPGAFMSVLGTSLLKQLVADRGLTQPAEILTRLDAEMRLALKQDGRDLTALDGMDIGILTLVPDLGQGLYAGANRPLLLQRGTEWVEYKGTRRHVGGRQVSDVPYATEALLLQPDDRLYLLTDGITDQLGGPEATGPGRKWGWARLKEQLAAHPLPSNDPAHLASLQQALRSWQGARPQLDDQLLLAVKV
jgi:serine phosphatase RsbU (regulator of sigma subunit)